MVMGWTTHNTEEETGWAGFVQPQKGKQRVDLMADFNYLMRQHKETDFAQKCSQNVTETKKEMLKEVSY